MNNAKIDIVIPWVDGSDPKWLAEKNKYSEKKVKIADCRYRDWGLLKYWFRGIEKNASWVNKIYFITWGHLPEWLDTTNEKLVIVNHKDYMPKEYLPTFNSNTILTNIHRIKGLSEQFIVFNDDFYLIDTTTPKDFFNNGIPYDNIALNVHCPSKSNSMQNICANNAAIINEYFDMRKCLKKDFKKWFNLKNGKELFRTLILLGCPRFPGFYYHHLVQGYLKSTYEKVWKLEYDFLHKASINKFRTIGDVNEWLMKDWQIAEGNVCIRKRKLGRVFYMQDQLMPSQGEEVIRYIKNKKGKCIAINDGKLTGNKSQDCIPKIAEAFEYIFPTKSSFEK